MILQCPECHTRYLVPDAAIGAEGRTVRCATCRHSWFQEPSEDADVAIPPATAPVTAPAIAPVPVAATMAPVMAGNATVMEGDRAPPLHATGSDIAVAPRPAPIPSVVGIGDMGGRQVAPDGYDAVASRPSRRRRNPARLWTVGAFAAGLSMLLAVAAIVWSGTPGIISQLGLLPAREPQLQVISDPVQRRYLDNGSVLFAVSGRVVNPTGTRQRVPDLRVDLLDRADGKGRSVYDWTITPQARMLEPRGSMEFNSSKLDVPQNARQLRLSFAGESAR